MDSSLADLILAALNFSWGGGGADVDFLNCYDMLQVTASFVLLLVGLLHWCSNRQIQQKSFHKKAISGSILASRSNGLNSMMAFNVSFVWEGVIWHNRKSGCLGCIL